MIKVENLIEVLEGEYEIYKEILDLSRKKTMIISEGKVKNLESLTGVEQRQVMKIGIFELKRQDIVEELVSELNIKDEDINISMLLGKIPSQYTERLNQVWKNITSIISELKVSNDLNARMIKNALDYIDFSINVMSSTVPEANNYGNNGEVPGANKKKFFDVKL